MPSTFFRPTPSFLSSTSPSPPRPPRALLALLPLLALTTTLLHAQATDPRLQALATGTAEEREAAAVELAQEPLPEALGTLVRLLEEDPAPRVRQAAAFALGSYDPPPPAAVDALLRAFEAPGTAGDPHLKTAVATALARLGEESPRVVEALIERLDHDEARDRQGALIVLERLEGAAAPAVPRVARLLAEDPDERVRRFAVATLEAVGPASRPAVPALLATVREDDSERIREYSARALPAVGAPVAQALPVLTAALEDPDWGVRAAAARALGEYGPEAAAARAALEAAAGDPEEPVRQAARQALEALGTV